MNNLENKVKFFALYWGQKLLTDKHGNPNRSWIDVESMYNTEAIKDGIIMLKPLSSISDEDAMVVCRMRVKKFEDAEEAKLICRAYFFGDLCLHRIIADELRQEGYALPWQAISVEQQIEYGWIKLIES